MTKQVDGGHFLAGVPKECFSNNNPCGQAGSSSKTGAPKQAAATAACPPAVSSEEDDSHLSDFTRVATADVSSDQILRGGIGVLR